MTVKKENFSGNLVAADVRRLKLFRAKEVRASLRRLLHFFKDKSACFWQTIGPQWRPGSLISTTKNRNP